MNVRVEIVLRSVEQVGLVRRIVGAVPPPEPYRFELAVTLENGEVLRSDAPFTVAEQR